MKRWRKHYLPSNNVTFKEYYDQTIDEKLQYFLEHKNGKVTSEYIQDDSGDEHVLLYDKDFLKDKEILTVNRVLIDGTFKTTPKIMHSFLPDKEAYQLLVILGIVRNHVCIFFSDKIYLFIIYLQ